MHYAVKKYSISVFQHAFLPKKFDIIYKILYRRYYTVI